MGSPSFMQNVPAKFHGNYSRIFQEEDGQVPLDQYYSRRHRRIRGSPSNSNWGMLLSSKKGHNQNGQVCLCAVALKISRGGGGKKGLFWISDLVEFEAWKKNSWKRLVVVIFRGQTPKKPEKISTFPLFGIWGASFYATVYISWMVTDSLESGNQFGSLLLDTIHQSFPFDQLLHSAYNGNYVDILSWKYYGKGWKTLKNLKICVF